MSAVPQSRPEKGTRLQLNGLAKSLGGSTVVDGVDLTINEGESVVLLGPSGCGKTTTLRMVAGFIDPDSGEIYLEGKLASGNGHSVPTERRNLGMVFQSYAVWPHKTVFENVAFSLAMARLDRAAIRSRVQQVLELVQLGRHAERYPPDLSGGQQQRVALARAIVNQPTLLLLDEPLSNLDAGLREEMRFELKRLHRDRGMTMLYVTHDQDEALVLADRIAVMNRGRIEQLDTPEAIYRRPASRFVASFVGSTNLIEGEVVGKDLARSRLEVRSELGEEFWATASADLVKRRNAGDKVTVSVRPEDVLLSANGAGMVAGIADVSFLGNHYDLSVKIAGKTLRALTRKPVEAADGRIVATFDPAAAWVLP